MTLKEFMDDPENVFAPFLRRYELLNAVAEQNHPNFIIVLYG